MGLFLFGKKGNCDVCGNTGSGKDLKDGFICNRCAGKSAMDVESWKSVTVEHAKAAVTAMDMNEQRKKIFAPDKKVGKYLKIDTKNRFWRVPSRKNVIFSYEELTGYDLMENGKPIPVENFGSILTDLLYGGNAAEKLTEKAIAEEKHSMDAIRTLRLKLYTSHPSYPEVWIKVLRDIDGIKHNSLETVMYFEILQKILKEITEEILGEKSE